MSRASACRVIAEKPADRPLPPKHSRSFVPSALVARRARFRSAGRGSRSKAAIAPSAAGSRLNRIRWLTCLLISSQLAPS